jgi:hypothetical protein
MGLTSYVYSLITTDHVLNALGIHEDSTFLQHSVDTPQARPLCILRWQAVEPGMPSADGSPVNHQNLQVWIHDDWGNYNRINQALSRLRIILPALVGVNVGDDDEWLSGARWTGDSEGLDDDVLRTATRNAQFRFTGSGI